ncbi:PAS domain-containing sensor histidine kinase [Neolewinella antarctica]|uniref:histidine kinase n=1 Tax=Neolewinella antarctica TaxID=442734 RepID=A0ABX0X8T4_9BACT|nr:PAS domain-containing sensor histidine kinase [Neolewinella antarctica]NJC25582.1 hypothetical protein [Neolewinella antarctica]
MNNADKTKQSVKHPKEELEMDDSLRLNALFEMVTDGVITMNTSGTIESVNSAAAKLFGYRADEMRGQKVNILMNGYDRTHHDVYLERYHETRKPHIIGIGREVIGRRKDGSEFPLRLAVSELKLEDKTIYTGMLHDLSEFKAAQRRVEELNDQLEDKVAERTAALRQREKELQLALGKERELNELKSRFLSMASHEFKTPLSTVLSSVELIELYGEAEQRIKRERHIGKIKDSVQQLTEVLNDFLSLSKVEQGEVEVRPWLLDLNAIVTISVEESEGQLRQGQQVVIDLADEPERLVADPKLLRHVLANLISNAAKYSEPGMSIIVSSGILDGRAYVSVADEGIGIPASDQAHIYDRFFRAGNVENVKGTGLGLNIVQHYVQLMGGEVQFTSKLGHGSTFTIYLPFRLDHAPTS